MVLYAGDPRRRRRLDTLPAVRDASSIDSTSILEGLAGASGMASHNDTGKRLPHALIRRVSRVRGSAVLWSGSNRPPM